MQGMGSQMGRRHCNPVWCLLCLSAAVSWPLCTWLAVCAVRHRCFACVHLCALVTYMHFGAPFDLCPPTALEHQHRHGHALNAMRLPGA